MKGNSTMVLLTLLEMMLGVAGLVCFYLDKTSGFVLCSSFCLLGFLFNVMRKSISGGAYRLFFGCIALGMIETKNMALLPDLPHFEKILIGLLWAACLFYPLSLVYLWIRAFVFKEDLTKKGSFD